MSVWHHVRETRWSRHFHSEPELNLIAAGSAAFGVGDSTISVAAGPKNPGRSSPLNSQHLRSSVAPLEDAVVN